MMGFSAREVLFSTLFAVAYGALYSMIYKTFGFLTNLIAALPGCFYEQMRKEKIFSVISIKDKINRGGSAPIFAFVSTVIYFFGFLLLSYFSLDGKIRIYMLIISSASLYFFNSTFYVVWNRILIAVFNVVLITFFSAARLVILPIKRLCTFYIKLIYIKKNK